MRETTHDPTQCVITGGSEEVNLGLIWPQWQGGGTSSVKKFASEFPFDVARRGYAVGSVVVEAVLPPHDGPTATVPVTISDAGLEERDGVEAKRSSWSNWQPPCRLSASTTRHESRPWEVNAQ
jgi:hypothetical protein